MTRDEERASVRQWVETAGILEQIRWRERRALDAVSALEAYEHLIDAALRVPDATAEPRLLELYEKHRA